MIKKTGLARLFYSTAQTDSGVSLKTLPPKHRKLRAGINVKRRLTVIPPAWRMVDDRGTGKTGSSLRISPSDLESWRICLAAKGIPHIITGRGAESRIFVPPIFEFYARKELAEFARERSGNPIKIVFANLRNTHLVLLFFLLLILWHAVTTDTLPLTGIPAHGKWIDIGCVWGDKVFKLHEYFRLVTALTLHADTLHLMNNVVLGAPIMALLARRIGFGAALFGTILAGTCGNAISCVYQPGYYRSVGFSTAVFATIGILCANMAVRDILEYGRIEKNRLLRIAFIPFAAGIAFLALFGAEGENVDYPAHIFGLACGMILGALYTAVTGSRIPGKIMQALLAMVALVIPALAWHFCLS